ncbi:glucose dehydrogenase [FAD, quinone]-like [Chironomus tepperi]|uniref:glucose dehydrogenase [FAD, quinone]-like n=1 Tax=Chironomus tepperi TaxID=113505 RepID=UPI00391F4C85
MLIKLTFLVIVLNILQNTAEIVNEYDNDELNKLDETSFVDFGPSLSKSGRIQHECLLRSTGSTNNIINGMYQNLVRNECALSSPSLWPADIGPAVFKQTQRLDNFDFIIVGAGSAGSILANRLSERSDWNVLLIEAGGDPPMESQIPYFFSTTWNTSVSYSYFGTKTSKASNGYKHGPYYPTGKMLGGTSSVNAMLYVRGVPEDYNNWNLTGWTFNDVLPYFKKSEGNKVFSSGKYHNINGPLSVENYGSTDPISSGIYEGIKELGYKKLDDYHQDEQIGFINSQGTLINAERCSTARAFLSTVRDRPNLKVLKYARVTRLIINNSKVEGVKFLLKGRSMDAFARKEVILSAGSFESPKILMLSGIGRKEDLAPSRINQVVDLPVGYNLQEHLITFQYFNYLKSSSSTDEITNYFNAMNSYLTQRSGIYTGIGCSNVLGFINVNDKKSKIPNIEYIHMCFSKQMIGFKEFIQNLGYNDHVMNQLIKANEIAPLFFTLSVLLMPKSRGTIKLRSRSIYDNPIINLNFFDDDDDLVTMVKSIREYRKLLNTTSFKKHEITETRVKFPECDVFPFDSDNYWRCYLKYMSSAIYHPVGTCKMGKESDPTTVVTPNLKVKGISGLRVIDASIMPTNIRGHTNAPTMMIAEKGADIIKSEYSKN